MNAWIKKIGMFSWLWLCTYGGVYAEEYVLGAQDVIEIKVVNEPLFSGRFTVGTNGAIDYPYLRHIVASGLTVSDLKMRMQAKLRDGYLKEPQISVRVVDYHSQKVFVLGAINRPGEYSLKENSRLLDILSQAGGISKTGSQRIFLLRKEAKVQPALVEVSPTVTESPSIGKTPQNHKETEVEGAEQPKTLPKPNPPQRDQINQTEMDKGEDQARFQTEPIVVDYHALVDRGDLSQNILLRGGDIINVPQANEITVLGAVNKPGTVVFDEGMTILSAISKAGGETPNGSLRSVYIIRKTAKGTDKIKIRLDKIIQNKSKNIPVQPDDVIVIPESFF